MMQVIGPETGIIMFTTEGNLATSKTAFSKSK
jgi:hypothetical protein